MGAEVIKLEEPDGGYWMPLFVTLAEMAFAGHCGLTISNPPPLAGGGAAGVWCLDMRGRAR